VDGKVYSLVCGWKQEKEKKELEKVANLHKT
jgi:hypothetical protein